MNISIKLLMLFLFISCNADADEYFDSKKHNFLVEMVTEGLEFPWSIEFLGKERILVTEKTGRLRTITNGQLSEPVKNIPNIIVAGQGGLLDVALDHNFENNQTIYFSYSAGNFLGIGTEVIKSRLINNELKNIEVLFRATPKSMGGQHFGSRILVSNNKHLFITLGDRGEKNRAQDLNDHAGSLIRINNDASIPTDNPFAHLSNVKTEIYSYGHRNIQGIVSNQDTGEIWTVEHGPQGGDELNLIKPGVNYGWPIITYGVNYVTGTKIGDGTHKKGMEQPVHHWIPSIAASSIMLYDGDQFPAWRGNILVSSLRFGQIVRLEIVDGQVISEERLLNGELGRIREVKQGPDGFLYLITDDSNGKLFRIKSVK